MFNALKYSKDLEAAGFSREQAEAAIDVFFKFMEHNFATKDDFAHLREEFGVLKIEFGSLKSEFGGLKSEFAELKSDFAGLRSEFSDLRMDFASVRHEFQMLEHRMTIKFGVMQAAGVGLLGAIIKFL